jgi:hypothetical protein
MTTLALTEHAKAYALIGAAIVAVWLIVFCGYVFWAWKE